VNARQSFVEPRQKLWSAIRSQSEVIYGLGPVKAGFAGDYLNCSVGIEECSAQVFSTTVVAMVSLPTPTMLPATSLLFRTKSMATNGFVPT